MNRYLIDVEDENGIYERDSEFYIRINIHNIVEPHAASSPSAVTISITDPCNTALIVNQPMTEVSTGIFDYGYPIQSTATYGEYTIEISTTTYTMVKLYDFYVFPWNIIPRIRRKSGIEQYKSISDHDLALIAWTAYKEVIENVFELYKDVKPVCDPDYAVLFDGSNTVVRTPYPYLADHDGDGQITGATTSEACDGDISGWWYDSDYAKHDCVITVNDSITGRITVTQNDGVTPIPNTNCGVYITFWTCCETFQLRLFRDAVEYLASHEVTRRFNELDRATLADLHSNQHVFLADPDRLEREYKKKLELIRNSEQRGVKA